MAAKKILITVFSLIIIGAFAFTVTWGVINFNKVEELMSGTGIYNSEDLNNAYDDGYNKGLKDKAEYTALIEEYRNTIATLNDTISQLTFQVTTLTNNNKDYANQIANLTEQKKGLESQVANLETVKAENEKTINELNGQIKILQTQVDQIPELNAQITSLQSLVTQLQTTNQLNADTIANLNAQIISLNNQIREMSDLSQNASAQIAVLNNRINELQASINYYESFIAGLENGEQAVATYEVDGTVWKIEIVNKGTEITLTKPANTETRIITGWKVNGEGALLGNTYVLNTNTKFVAQVVHKFAVKFMNGDQDHNSQYVVENKFVTLPEAPVKDGYDFLGWSTNGVDVIDNIESIPVTQNTTYYAVFVKVHTVTFMVNDQVVATKKVRNGNYANADDVTVETDGTFKGWAINGAVVDLSTYQILADTVFTAEISYDDWQKVYLGDLATYFKASTVWTDGVNYYATGVYDNVANRNVNYVFDFDTDTWVETDVFNRTVMAKYVWTDGVNIYYSVNNGNYEASAGHYVLDVSTHTWSKMTWNDPGGWFQNIFHGGNVWTDGVNYYLSGSYKPSSTTYYCHYVLNVATHTWSKMTWNGLTDFSGDRVWTDGMHVYMGASYILDVATHTWSRVTWNGDDFKKNVISGGYFDVSKIWTDGINCYYSGGSLQYKLDIATYTWVKIEWTGASIFGYDIWTNGVDYYYTSGSREHYKLNRSTLAETTNSTDDTANVYIMPRYLSESILPKAA